MSALETLRISVQPSPSSNDHEVMLWVENDNLLSRFDGDAMGLDPDDILVTPCPLLPSDRPRTVLIGRCDCGVIGCGDAEVTIARDGDVVSWTTDVRTIGVRFDAAQYIGEIERALADRSWETPERTAAWLIAASIDRAHLARAGLTFTWASGRARSHVMTVALTASGYQILVRVPWRDEPPHVIAEMCSQLLGTDPRTWPDVQWFPQAPGLEVPAMAGDGWRRGS